MKEIEARLREKIGLDVEALGRPSFERTVGLRMQDRGLTNLEEYSQLVRTSPEEWNQLIEALVVAETWFFRDPEAFTGLVQFVFERWLSKPRAGLLRVLSVPCCSGEEPYSLAMALLDAGLDPSRFQIEAIDISERALARARRGVYGKNSFRNKDRGFRDRYFQPGESGFVLHSSVREQVHFRRGNLLEKDALGERTYDCIFCRNLLIYLDDASQEKTLRALACSLRAGGMLFVGPAEQAVALKHGFVPTQVPMAFEVSGTEKPASGPVLTKHAAGGVVQPDIVETPVFSLDVKMEPATLTAGELVRARKLADRGHLLEAALICEAYLKSNRDSAAAYYLLGLVRDAAGQANALDCYRRALYLDPNHHDTLLQMALLAERSGNIESATNLRRRAQRNEAGRANL